MKRFIIAAVCGVAIYSSGLAKADENDAELATAIRACGSTPDPTECEATAHSQARRRDIVRTAELATAIRACGSTPDPTECEAIVHSQARWRDIARTEALRDILFAAGLKEERKCSAGHPLISMSEAEAVEEWCRPDQKNKTETTRGTKEQWVYPGRGYLYFNDGILVAIQRSH